VAPIKAIVLTFDRNRVLTDHMIFQYAKLWPDHPFQFRVPYQELGPSSASGRVEYRRSPPGIKETVLTLLEDLADDELIYWSIDDKYPIKLDVPRIARIGEWLSSERAARVSGVLFCRCRHMWDDRYLTGETITDPWGHEYLARTSYAQIWVHQFLRVGVIRHLFESFQQVIDFPRRMDRMKDALQKPADHRLFVSRRNLAVFGESTVRGTLTLNCRRSLSANGLPAPSWAMATTPGQHFSGTRWRNARQRVRCFVWKVTGYSPNIFC
jgi:hypothetical protein